MHHCHDQCLPLYTLNGDEILTFFLRKRVAFTLFKRSRAHLKCKSFDFIAYIFNRQNTEQQISNTRLDHDDNHIDNAELIHHSIEGKTIQYHIAYDRLIETYL